MNLINELGGYEMAKEKVIALGEQLYSMMQPDNFLSEMHNQQKVRLAMVQIEEALLEYRRTNNIFEVKDYLVNEQYTGLLRVTRVMKKRLDIDYLNPQVMNHVCSSSILIKHVKHATDAEIKAGYKL